MGIRMLKIVLAALGSIFLSMLAGSVRKEYGFMTAICAALFIFSYGVRQLSVFAEKLRAFEQAVGLDQEYITILLKMAGIAYLTQFAVSLCRDAGQGAIAGQVGFAGKISMLLVSFPVLEALVEMIGALFQ